MNFAFCISWFLGPPRLPYTVAIAAAGWAAVLAEVSIDQALAEWCAWMDAEQAG